MNELTRILIGSLVLLLVVNESYQTKISHQLPKTFPAGCYDREGVLNPYGRFCFDISPECWWDSDPTRLASMGNHFYLFRRRYSSRSCSSGRREINWYDHTFSGFSRYKETVVLIHGWQSTIEHEYAAALCNSFMELDDYNIIMVDWNIMARQNYHKSVMDSILVAKELAVLLEELHEQRGLRYADVHLVGHSLGAHLAGYTGMFLHGQIGHITGLDPAALGFWGYLSNPECHLDETDADFVDVIHSDEGLHLFGLEEPVGHQDFYPNKGDFVQPSCAFLTVCSHVRALDYYLSSMLNFDIQPGEDCSFVATPISPTTCGWRTCPRMGIHAQKGVTGSFSIEMDSNNCGQDFIYET